MTKAKGRRPKRTTKSDDFTLKRIAREATRAFKYADQLVESAREGLIHEKEVDRFILAWATYRKEAEGTGAYVTVELPKHFYPKQGETIN